MSFIRTRKRENPFVQLDKEYIGNGKLSLKSTGLLTYFLSKPDGWKIRLKDVQNRFTDGETSIRSALKELIKEGYVNRFREREEGGKFGEYIYEVYERPEFNPKHTEKKEEIAPKRENQEQAQPKRDFPKMGNPELDNPELENRVHSNNDFSNNDFNNNELINKEEEEEGAKILNEFFIENITSSGNAIVKQKLNAWLHVLPFEVIQRELEQCALLGAKSWNYVERALVETKDLGIVTIEGLENKYSQHANKKIKKKKTSRGKRVIRRELTPDWLNSNDSINNLDGAAAAELEEKRKRLEEVQRKYKKEAL